MKLHFTLDPLTFRALNRLPGGWETKNYYELLALMDYGEPGDMAESELEELCFMALADLGEEKAALMVLTYLLGNRLSKGQIGNLAQEILVEKLWEDFADLSFHETLFNAHQILYDAFRGVFPRPEAFGFELRVAAANSRDLSYFAEETEARLIRLIVQGMAPNTKIARLYEKELIKGPFEDAQHILWQLKKADEQAMAVVFGGISSPYWFADLKQAGPFKAVIEWDAPPPSLQ